MEKAVEYHIKAGNNFRAAGIRERQDRLEEAYTLLVEGEHFDQAARIAEKRGEYEDAMKCYEQTDVVMKGKEREVLRGQAKQAQLDGNIEMAVNLYEKARDYLTGADLAKDAGLNERAVELYKKEIENI